MKRIDLIKVDNTVKIGDQCPYIEPNITEDCIFYSDGEPIGFYITKMPEKMCKLADLANKEFNSKNVNKTSLDRKPSDGWDEKKGIWKYKNIVSQMSAILGSVPPKPHMRRPYATISSVHVPSKWKFANLFTSSISNYNISAPFHRDTGNIVGAVNVIICKKHNSKGGDLHVPDYNATIGQQDNSILVYPAWRNVHGVTPIIPIHEGGYRNSLIFYPLKAFVGLD